MTLTAATIVRMPRKRKPPEEVSRMRREIAKAAWERLTPEERTARMQRAWDARPTGRKLTQAELQEMLRSWGATLTQPPTDAELDALIERLRAAGVVIEGGAE